MVGIGHGIKVNVGTHTVDGPDFVQKRKKPRKSGDGSRKYIRKNRRKKLHNVLSLRFSIFPPIGALFPKTDDGFTRAQKVFRVFLANGEYFVLQCIYHSKAKLKAHLIHMVLGRNQ